MQFSHPGMYPMFKSCFERIWCHFSGRPIGPLGGSRTSSELSSALWSVRTKIGWSPIQLSHLWRARIIAYVSNSRGTQLRCDPPSLRERNATGTVRFSRTSCVVGIRSSETSCSRVAPTAYSLESTRRTNGLSGLTIWSINSEHNTRLSSSKAACSVSPHSILYLLPFLPISRGTFSRSCKGAAILAYSLM